MKPENLRDLNVIGAFVLALSDDFRGAMQELSGGNESACAALIVIQQESGLTIDRLSKILGLSQPGTVRLVDRLAAEHLVERKAGGDRRSVALRLTEAGKRQVKSLLIGRRHSLAEALRQLDPGEMQALAAIAEKVLQGLGHSQIESDRRCRLCDGDTCPDETCPMAVA